MKKLTDSKANCQNTYFKLMIMGNDKMPSCWNGKFTKCKVDQMSRSINLQVSELRDWCNAKLTKC